MGAEQLARETITARWIAQWPELQPDVPFTFENEGFDASAVGSFVRVGIVHSTRRQASTGLAGSRRFEVRGSIYVQVFFEPDDTAPGGGDVAGPSFWGAMFPGGFWGDMFPSDAGGSPVAEVAGGIMGLAKLIDSTRAVLEGVRIAQDGTTEAVHTRAAASQMLGTDGARLMAIVMVPFVYHETR